MIKRIEFFDRLFYMEWSKADAKTFVFYTARN